MPSDLAATTVSNRVGFQVEGVARVPPNYIRSSCDCEFGRPATTITVREFVHIFFFSLEVSQNHNKIFRLTTGH